VGSNKKDSKFGLTILLRIYSEYGIFKSGIQVSDAMVYMDYYTAPLQKLEMAARSIGTPKTGGRTSFQFG